MTGSVFKYPRLFVEAPLDKGKPVALEAGQAHYVRTVLRKSAGDALRLFNGQDGEWRAALGFTGKKEACAEPEEQLRPQPDSPVPVHLYFAPIKKNRMDFLIEKAVELGVTDLHPVLTQNTENRHLKPDRISQQIIEAAEQCERLDVPALHDMKPLIQDVMGEERLYACIERQEAVYIGDALSGQAGPRAFLVGPEGGFTAEEITHLAHMPNIVPVSLGQTILRSETACLFCLSAARLY